MTSDQIQRIKLSPESGGSQNTERRETKIIVTHKTSLKYQVTPINKESLSQQRLLDLCAKLIARPRQGPVSDQPLFPNAELSVRK